MSIARYFQNTVYLYLICPIFSKPIQNGTLYLMYLSNVLMTLLILVTCLYKLYSIPSPFWEYLFMYHNNSPHPYPAMFVFALTVPFSSARLFLCITKYNCRSGDSSARSPALLLTVSTYSPSLPFSFGNFPRYR